MVARTPRIPTETDGIHTVLEATRVHFRERVRTILEAERTELDNRCRNYQILIDGHHPGGGTP